MKRESRRTEEDSIYAEKKANGKPKEPPVVQSEKTSTDQLDKNAAMTSATAPAYKKKGKLEEGRLQNCKVDATRKA